MDWTRIKHFKPEELRCNCCLAERMNQQFMERLDRLREHLGFEFVVRSGYRCPAHNERVSRTGPNGPHTTGHAVDLYLFGSRAFDVIRWAPTFYMSGIGIKGHGDHARRFVHLDDLETEGARSRPTIWTYP